MATDDVSVNPANATSIILGNGSIIDMSKSPAAGIGVYSKGVLRSGMMASVTDNGSNLVTGTDGIGLYLEGTELIATGGTITSPSGITATGIYTDSHVVSGKNITLTGDKSIGIYNYGVNSQYGAPLVNIINTGTITLANSTNNNDPSIGIYTKHGNIDHRGSIIAGAKW